MASLPGFVGPSYTSQANMAAGDRLINLFVEDILSAAPKARRALVPAPGMVDFATTVDSPGRGLYFENDRLFAVFGTSLCEISSAGVVTVRGAVLDDGNPAQLTTNGTAGGELMVSAGTKGYRLDLATNILTNPVNDVTQVGQVDGFVVALDTLTGTMKISEVDDASTWDPLQIAQRSAAADDWIAMFVHNREIFLWGAKTGEVWRNAGLSPFPFALRSDASHEVGIAAIWSAAPFKGSIAWLGQTQGGTGVYWMNGYTPEKISPEGLDWEIQTYKDGDGVSDAVGWSYEREGHEFYVLTFVAAGHTWVCDAKTFEWHERGKWSNEANDFTAYRPRFHAQAFGKNLVCDSSSNKVYSLSSLVFTDVGGSVLRRLRQTPHAAAEHKMVFFPYAELECDRGVGTGLGSGQGADPEVVLQYSDNGGRTFGAERARKVGKQSEFDTIVRWDGCGAARDRVWRLYQTDPAACRWYDLYVQARVGRT